MKQSSMQTFLSFSGYECCVSNKTGELVQNEPMKLVYSLVYSTDLPGRVLFHSHSLFQTIQCIGQLEYLLPFLEPTLGIPMIPRGQCMFSQSPLARPAYNGMLYLPTVRNSCSLQSDYGSWLVGWFCTFPCMWMMWLGYLWHYVHLFESRLYEYAGGQPPC